MLTVENAHKRQDLIQKIRSFFYDRDILEVETPILSRASSLDPYIDVFQSEFYVDGITEAERQKCFLTTSPEFHMKRLLSHGYPSIYQITRAFRNGEQGKKHNPEFTILEWYKLGQSFHELIEECSELLSQLGFHKEFGKISYKDAFEKYLEVDPFVLNISNCRELCDKKNIPPIESETLDDWLIYLLAVFVEPNLGRDGKAEYLIDYPASQAALAQLYEDPYGNKVAKRFELYIDGVELCNGFEELVDAEEQEARFICDVQERISMNKEVLKIDRNFLDALKQGLPNCSGVAFGVDRLFMVLHDISDIRDTLCFDYGEA